MVGLVYIKNDTENPTPPCKGSNLLIVLLVDGGWDSRATGLSVGYFEPCSILDTKLDEDPPS